MLARRPTCYNRYAVTEEREEPEVLPPEVRTAATELVWRCSSCGYLRLRSQGLPESCPDCGAPREDFYLVTED